MIYKYIQYKYIQYNGFSVATYNILPFPVIIFFDYPKIQNDPKIPMLLFVANGCFPVPMAV